jgi:glucosamine-6-phosphate deaminase
MSRSISITVRPDGLIDSFRSDLLHIHLYKSRLDLGSAAAAAVAVEIRSLIAQRNRAMGIFASDPSHIEFLDDLIKTPDIEWTRVIAFHLDEYLGMSEEAPQSLRRFLLDRLVKRVPIAEFHAIRAEAANPEAVCANYAALLKSRQPDFVVLGIGEDGRLGSIDPPLCDFNDAAAVKVVELDEDHRRRYVQDGVFRSIDEAPRGAVSLTIPTIMDCRTLFAIAHGRGSQNAIRKTIEGEISPVCPASILRTHPNAHLFLDRESVGSRQ